MAPSLRIRVRDKGGKQNMSKLKDKDKARKRMFKYLKDAIESLEKAENDNIQWEFVPEAVFKEILEVLGKVEVELTKIEA
jgi:hypothetical protein